jgi:predicted nucleic acid-binding protein
MGQEYLIDTNIIIDFLAKKLPSEFTELLFDDVINNIPNISIITKIEILGFNTNQKDYDLLRNFINDCNVLGLSDDIVNETILIRQRYKTKLPDAIIAATAQINKLTLITRNVSDFNKIKTVKTLNPFKN